MSRAQDVITNLLAFADIRINGARPWDIQVHDRRFFSRVLASGTLGFGESYMDGWWDCDALDEMCCRAIRAGLEKRFAFRLPNVWALITALLANQQIPRRSRKVGQVHYDLKQRFLRSNARSEHAIFLCALRRGRRSRLGATAKAGLDLPKAASATRLAPAGHRLRLGRLGSLCRSQLRLPGSRDNNFTGAMPLRATLVSRIGRGNPAARLPRSHRTI